MANERHKRDFKKAMELVRSMSDDELLVRLRSHGKGEYGIVFGNPADKVSFDLKISSRTDESVSLIWDEQNSISADFCGDDAANDNTYAKAA